MRWKNHNREGGKWCSFAFIFVSYLIWSQDEINRCVIAFPWAANCGQGTNAKPFVWWESGASGRQEDGIAAPVEMTFFHSRAGFYDREWRGSSLKRPKRGVRKVSGRGGGGGGD